MDTLLMIDLIIFLAIGLFFTFFIGNLIQKLNAPWFIASIIFGFLFAIFIPISSIDQVDGFTTIAQVGMFFLLFLVGFEIRPEKFRAHSRFMLKTSIAILIAGITLGTVFIYFVFQSTLLIAFLTSLALTTVGVPALLPILHNFELVNTHLGQIIIGIGTIDDIFNLFILVIVLMVADNQNNPIGLNFNFIFWSLLGLMVLAIGIMKLKVLQNFFKNKKEELIFLFLIACFFLFTGIGDFSNSGCLASLLAGFSLRYVVPRDKEDKLEQIFRVVIYGFFAPIFFISIGLNISLISLIQSPLILVGIFLISALAKFIAVYSVGYKIYRHKITFLLATSLTVRFAFSIILVNILFHAQIIDVSIFSAIVSSNAIFLLILPTIFSILVGKWKKEIEVLNSTP
jgi:Kef-type K+ transport system membrane component KefB